MQRIILRQPPSNGNALYIRCSIVNFSLNNTCCLRLWQQLYRKILRQKKNVESIKERGRKRVCIWVYLVFVMVVKLFYSLRLNCQRSFFLACPKNRKEKPKLCFEKLWKCGNVNTVLTLIESTVGDIISYNCGFTVERWDIWLHVCVNEAESNFALPNKICLGNSHIMKMSSTSVLYSI